jgi:phosphate transport system ATP-binding protein
LTRVPIDPTHKGRVEARRYSFWYGEKQALHEIDLAIRPRSITALIGPSGCGKSTFLRSLTRLNEIIPDTRLTGEILLDGEDVYARNVDVVNLRQRVGMVFQRWNPFPRSILDNVTNCPRLNTRPSRAALDGIVEDSHRRAAFWDQVNDRLRHSAHRL